MHTWITRFSLSLLIILTVLISPVGPVAAQELSADLAIHKTANRKHIKIGQTVTFTITVTNRGPDAATNVYFGDALPDPLNLVSASCNRGPTFGGACLVASLAPGRSATILIVATPITNPARSERRFTNTAFIGGSDTFDPNPANNTDSLRLHIVGKTP